MEVKITETEDRIEIWWGGAKYASLVKKFFSAMGFTPEWAIATQFADERLLCDFIKTLRDGGAFKETEEDREKRVDGNRAFLRACVDNLKEGDK